LSKYDIPESPNQHIRCLCHVVNLVVQSILAALGEADDPEDADHFLLNKAQPLHLDIDNDPDQVALDHEEFNDDSNAKANVEENVAMEDEEKPSAMRSPLSKVCLHLTYPHIVLRYTSCISSILLRKSPRQPLNSGKNFGSARW
jgi:hypothetical protein